MPWLYSARANPLNTMEELNISSTLIGELKGPAGARTRQKPGKNNPDKIEQIDLHATLEDIMNALALAQIALSRYLTEAEKLKCEVAHQEERRAQIEKLISRQRDMRKNPEKESDAD